MSIEDKHVEHRASALDAFGPDPFAATAFGDLTRTAADLLDAPMAAISVVDSAGGRLRAAVGIAENKPSADAFATWTLDRSTSTLVIEDAGQDPELQKALADAGLPNVGFCVAVPLTLSTGQAIGALCVMGDAPRSVPEGAIDQLKFLSDQVVRTLEDRRR